MASTSPIVAFRANFGIVTDPLKRDYVQAFNTKVYNNPTTPTADTSAAFIADFTSRTTGRVTGLKVTDINNLDTTGWAIGVEITSVQGGATANRYAIYSSIGVKSYFAGNIGIGDTSPVSRLSLSGNLLAAAWGVSGIQFRGNAATYTDTDTAGTRATGTVFSIAQPTFAASNAVTITDAATAYIADAPAAGLNMTLGTAYALWVAAGLSRFGGTVRMWPATETMLDARRTGVGNAGMEIGTQDATGGNAYLDFHVASGVDFHSRIIRNSGVNGNFELTQTGTGGFYFSGGNVGIGTATPASKLDVTTTALGTAQTNTSGLALINTTAAAAGAQQISPALRWRGQGWKTNVTAASQPVDFRSYVVPVQGAASPTGYLTFESAINDGAYANRFTIDSNGNVGIGTTTPLSPLEVRGAITSDNGSGAGFFGNNLGEEIQFSDLNSRAILVTAGVSRLLVDSSGITPAVDNTYDVGTGPLRWRDARLSRDLYIDGAVQTTLKPATTGNDLGTTILRWDVFCRSIDADAPNTTTDAYQFLATSLSTGRLFYGRVPISGYSGDLMLLENGAGTDLFQITSTGQCRSPKFRSVSGDTSIDTPTSAENILLQNAGVTIASIRSTQILPGADNLYDLGANAVTPAFRWRNITVRDSFINEGDNLQWLQLKFETELTVIAAAAFTDTTISFVDKALAIGVTTKVTSAIPGATTYDVGIVGATTRYGSGIDAATGSSASCGTDGPYVYASITTIRITPNVTPANSQGRVRVTIHYIRLFAASS